MNTTEQQPNTSSLQTLEAEVSLTKQELEDFRKLSKEEQEKLKLEKISKLNDLQNKLDHAIQEAIKTGKLDEAKKLKEQLEKEIQELEQQMGTLEISTEYNRPDKKKETITLDLEQKLQEFTDFYNKTKLDLPPDFEDTIKNIWENNQNEIQEAIEQNGFDDLLIVPGNIPLADLAEKMKMEKGYYEVGNFTSGGSFSGVISKNVDKNRIILIHKTQELTDRPELAKSLNTKGQDVNLDQALTLEDYLIFQRKYFEETKKHLDEKKYTWLATKSGTRLVHSYWNPDDDKLCVNAFDLGAQDEYLGVRPSRSFF